MNDLVRSQLPIPLTFETVAQITETVNRVFDYLDVRDRLVARMGEIDRDFYELRDSRDAMVAERERQRAFTEIIVEALMDRGEHELAVRAFEAFMNASPNLSAAVVEVIKSRLELNPIQILIKQ